MQMVAGKTPSHFSTQTTARGLEATDKVSRILAGQSNEATMHLRKQMCRSFKEVHSDRLPRTADPSYQEMADFLQLYVMDPDLNIIEVNAAS